MFSLLFTTAAFAATLVVHDPTFYEVLAPQTKLECRYHSDDSFGLFLERGDSKEVRVSLITKNENEGDKSAYIAEFVEKDISGVHLRFRERTGDSGKEIEIVLGNRLCADYGYRLPGAIYMATRLFKKDEHGQEDSDLYLDGSFKLACKAPR